MAEHNLLAVRVMVTTDGSSSELESDVGENISNSESSDPWSAPPEPDLALGSNPIRRYFSVDQPNTPQEEGSIKSKAADALRRASSFQASTSSMQQNWRKMIRSTFPSLIGKKTEVPEKETSSNAQSAPDRDVSNGEVDPYGLTKEHFKPRPPVSEGKSNEIHSEFPTYVPHQRQTQHNIKDRDPRVDTDVHPRGILKRIIHSKEDHAATTEYTLEKVNKNGVEPSSGIQNVFKPTVDPYVGVKENNQTTDVKNQVGTVDQDIKDNPKLKKLVLSKEEKSNLLDWDHRNTGRSNLELKRSPSIELSIPAAYKSTSIKTDQEFQLYNPPKYPLGANDSTFLSQANQKDKLNIPKTDTAEGAPTSRPKSPFRIIASALKWPLNSATDSTKTTSNDKPQPISSSSVFQFPATLGKSKGVQRSQSNVEQGTRPLSLFRNAPTSHRTNDKTELNGVRAGNSGNSPLNSCTQPVETCRKLIHEKSPNSNTEDPMLHLLERINLGDNSPKESSEDIFSRNRKNSIFSSLRFKDKASETIKDGPELKSDLWSFLGNLRKKVNEREINGPTKRTITPFSAFFTENVLNKPAATSETGSRHLPARAPVNGSYSSTSEEECEHGLPSSSLKVRRASKRRRKLEREAKQKLKQEELKRLHKAQSIQRQLQEIEERQRALEVKGVKLEKALRGESDSGAQDEAQLLQEWLRLVMQKNKLIRYESELLIVAQGLELEDHQSRLEQKLREKMAVDESQRDEKDQIEEQETLCEMMRVIEQRDKLVSFLEQQRLREKAEDRSLEDLMSSKGFEVNEDLENGLL